jgi:hypothetical protein
MPTVLRWEGFRFYFYSHEPNEPPHIHVDRRDSSAKFWLNPVALASNHGFAPRELSVIRGKVVAERRRFEEAWYGYFGPKG